MPTKFKSTGAIVALACILTTATITAPLTKMFGKFYKNSRDFVCCKDSKLVVNHYYTINVFWLQVSDGYTQENAVAKSANNGCNIVCAD